MADSEILEGWPGHPDPETIGRGRVFRPSLKIEGAGPPGPSSGSATASS